MSDVDTDVGQRMVAAARSFIGVPWEHQGRSHQGVDCCGFIAEVALLSGAATDVRFERDYRRRENGERMLELLTSYLDPVEAGQEAVGDVLALCDEQLKYPTQPVHLAFLTQTEPYWMMIHASERGVREHRMDIRFRRRVVSAWRARGTSVASFCAENVAASASGGKNVAEGVPASEENAGV